MDGQKFVSVIHLCKIYSTEISFFQELNDNGLIEIVSDENTLYLHQDSLFDVERIIRLHRELHVNIEGVDVVLNLLEKVEHLQDELYKTQSRLRLYEDDF